MRHLSAVFAMCVLALMAFASPASAQWPGYDGYRSAPAYRAPPQYVPEADDPYDAPPPPRVNGRSVYGAPAYPEDYEPGMGRPLPGYGGQDAREDVELNAASQERTGALVSNPTHEAPGTIVVDTRSRHLYLVMNGDQAMQYGIGVGRQGFAWKGTARVAHKAEWPTWTPPAEMLKRRPDLPTQMVGGIENPLGARALYLFQGNRDTLFRIHGTNEPDTIGKAVSSGCIRMMNADVIDLYKRVPVGTRVVVL